MPKKLSRTLHKRTKLNPEQLQRVKDQYGDGDAGKYDPDGIQSLAKTRGLAKARANGKKFVLFSDRLKRRAYVGVWEARLTFEIKEALVFVEGFDSETMKKDYYNAYFKEQIDVLFNWQIKNL